MKKSFTELKNEFVDLCKKHSACQPEFKKLKASENEAEMLSVIYNNIQWCISEGVISHEFFSHFDYEAFLNSGIANTGKENTGFVNSGNSNSGDSNSGNSNSGNWNSGNWNSGNWNSGNSNSGNRNSGNRNSGNRNSGNRNSGNWNSGNRNSGNSNSGNWNSGNSNSGDSNSGYRNSGAFSTDTNPFLVLFDKPTTIRVREWEQMEVYSLMYNIDPTIWVPMSIMTDEEKAANPKYETTEGYLKTIPMHEAWANFWGNLADSKKKLFTDLPNFDADKFEVITGIKVNPLSNQ